MGNSSVKEAAEEAKGNRSLNLSCKLTPKQYVKVSHSENNDSGKWKLEIVKVWYV